MPVEASARPASAASSPSLHSLPWSSACSWRFVGHRAGRLGSPRRPRHGRVEIAEPRRQCAGGDAERTPSMSAASSPTPAEIANADRIAIWNGSNWSAVSSTTEQIADGEVFAIAVAGGKVYAGGVFANAGAMQTLTSRSGTAWLGALLPPRPNPRTIGNVRSLAGHRIRPSTSGETSRTARASHQGRLPARVRPGLRHAEGHRHCSAPHFFSGPVKALAAHQRRDASTRAEGSATSRTSRRPTTSPTLTAVGGWHADGLWRRRPRLRRLCAGRLRTRADRKRD